MFTVKEASEIMGISPHSLRFYDKEGLLPTLSRTESGRRMFSYEDLEWVYNIQCWRSTGMPLAEIRRYIGLLREGKETLEERFEIILQQRDRAIEEAKAARERVKILQYKVNWYEALRQGADPDKWRPNIHAIVQKAQAKKKREAAESRGKGVGRVKKAV